MKPLCVDLCCGNGGWAKGFLAEGWDVIGYDIDNRPNYPGEFRQRDVRSFELKFRPDLIVASPPCEEFSRHQMPWTRSRNPPQPDLSVVEACFAHAQHCMCPIVLENVRMAQQWLGKSKWHAGSYYLWGDVPDVMPKIIHRPKESWGSKNRLDRAEVPIQLARWIAKCFSVPGAPTGIQHLLGFTDAQIATGKG